MTQQTARQQPVFEKNIDIYLTTFADFYKEALDRIQWKVIYLKSDFCVNVTQSPKGASSTTKMVLKCCQN